MNNKKHVIKLPMDAINECVVAEPKVECREQEVLDVLKVLGTAVDSDSYVLPKATEENPALSDDYIFDKDDQDYILKDLSFDHFVAKVKDVGKGAKKRLENGLPQEYLYVFQYPCQLFRRDADQTGKMVEKVLIYIKINNRVIPYKKLFVVSFHKNRAN